jgi:Cu/Ag efflux protein CusF
MTTTARSAAALLLLLAAACGSDKPAAPPERYEVKGEIMRLPSAEKPEVLIRHEAIPTFKDEAGKVVGMEAMTMPFALAEGVVADGLATGDAVEFTLEVNWALDKGPVRVVRLAKSDVIHKMDLEGGQLPPTPSGEAPPPADTPK